MKKTITFSKVFLLIIAFLSMKHSYAGTYNQCLYYYADKQKKDFSILEKIKNSYITTLHIKNFDKYFDKFYEILKYNKNIIIIIN